MLKEIFELLLRKYSADNGTITKLWREIKVAYMRSGRHYHTLQHLESLLLQLQVTKHEINNWDAVLFALYYHDIVYNTLRNNNEEKSAVLAVKRMNEIGVDNITTDKCSQIILATKQHQWNEDNDINLFTDADLSILGASWNDYETYFKNIRKEYAIYPNMVYNPGRKKVLQHFLSMKQIFKTAFFFGKFEKNARQNLKKELETLH